jgi:hypothetical protein
MMLSLNCLINKKKRIYWDIKKSPVGIGILNQRIEEECNCSVPIYYSLIGSLHTKNRQKINESCRKYLETILNNKKYYCTSLFTFIKFDIIKQEVFATDGATMNFQAVVSGDRQSQAVDEYEDKGGFI